MKKIIVIIIVAGLLYHYRYELPFLSGSGAFDSNGKPEIWVFTKSNCGGWCKKGMNYLRGRQAPVLELSLDNDEEAQQLYKELGRGNLPYIVTGYQKVAGFYPAKISSALAVSYGDQYLTSSEKRYYKNHFYPDGAPKIYMYGASWCPYCKKMRDELESRDMDYVEIDVEKSSNQMHMVNTMEIDGYPVIYVGYRRVHQARIGNVIEAMKKAKPRVL